MEYGIFSILPILITLVIVFVGKNVFLALLSGIFSAAILIGFFTGDYLTGMESIAMVFSDSGTAMTTFFVLMTGAIMCVVSRSGGVEGLVLYCTEKRKLISSPVAAQLISFVLGLLLFVDGTSSIAVTAMVGKPFFKKFGVPNEKLALISNSTGAAVAWLIPFGSACAVLTAFFRPVAQQLGIQEDPFSVVMSSTIFQFYTLALLPLVFLSIVFGFELGGMGKACRQMEAGSSQQCTYETQITDRSKVLARNMLFPIAFMVALIFILLLVTGGGSFSAGNGSPAVFVAGLITLVLTGIWYRIKRICKMETYVTWCMDGMKNMFDLVLVLALAYAFGSLLSTLGTASFLAGYARLMPREIMLVMGYLTATFIAYATGTSGGTAAVLVPVLTPIMVPVGIPAQFVLGVIISGAVFGDQNSPISDSVILTSSMTGVKIMDHVKTQMPYTLVAWAIALAGYIILGAACL